MDGQWIVYASVCMCPCEVGMSENGKDSFDNLSRFVLKHAAKNVNLPLKSGRTGL